MSIHVLICPTANKDLFIYLYILLNIAFVSYVSGVDILLYPGAFNMKTGPLHWELLLRARAVDEQVFVAGVSPAQDSSADYVAWGHSMVVDPWGHILKQAKFQEELIVTDLG